MLVYNGSQIQTRDVINVDRDYRTDVNMSMIQIVSDVCHGELLKWTNYMKGYRSRWFLLQNGFLSYYK